jgi:hypothetical protein
MPKGKKDSDRTPSESRFDTPSLDLDGPESTSRQNESSTRREADTSKTRHNEESKSRSVESSTSDGGAEQDAQAPSRLQQQLAVLMDEVDLPAAPRQLSEKTNAHISTDTDQRLRQAASVLEQRYGKGFSKSLLVDYALRAMLRDLREEADDSQIARILDQLFADGE